MFSEEQRKPPAVDLGEGDHPAEVIFLFRKPQQTLQWVS